MKKNILLRNAFSNSSLVKQIKKAIPLCLLLILSQTACAQSSWLEGSWGVTFPIYGGERMDNEITNNDYDYIAGAQEIVDELPSVGHVITNLTQFANSHYFTLSSNTNVNVANEIYPGIVPNSGNDQILFDVMQIFKNSDKKIILYISTSFFFRADTANTAIKPAWVTYYTNNFGGDEYAAYRNLMEGFIEQVKDYADGYWLDTVDGLNTRGKLDDFVAMIRATDPTAMVTTNKGKSYFSGIEVDSDGFDDSDPIDYKIVSHEPLNNLQDFTHGHVTPIGQGAPVNSWGYDEYTIPDMAANPWFNYNGTDVLRHAWFPVRERWHVPTFDLVYGLEQAYRFTKKVVDAGAAITWATTTDPGYVTAGYMMADEMSIMKEIHNRLLSNPVLNYEPYVRPECAYLVSETTPDPDTCTTDTTDSLNLALNGTATQSETLNGAEASRAIDDDTNGNFGSGSVTASAAPDAWWQVDLGNEYNINDINVFNRTNTCCTNRLANFTVLVIDSNGDTTYSQTITAEPNPSVTIKALGAVGQIIRIESNTGITLNIAEVQVFGDAILGIEDNTKIDKLSVYPNPTSDRINIDYKSSKTASIKIIDYLGKTILSGTIQNGRNTVDLSNLSSGLYIIKVSDDYETYTRKIIKK
jgi:hypothetical protein